MFDAEIARLVSVWIAVASVLSFSQFGFDKAFAVRGMWRISEATLLATALFGGAVGAKIGQRFLRHKTRKQPFAGRLHVMLGLNIITVPLIVLTPTRSAALGFLARLIG